MNESRDDCIIGLLRGTPLVDDERELARIVRLPMREQLAVAVLIHAGEADTVEGALGSMAGRENADRCASERRKRFEVIDGPDAER